MIDSRKIEDLTPRMQVLCKSFIASCKAAGISVIITSTLRDNEKQAELYAKGRTTPGPKVTNANAGQSVHNFAEAFDFVPLVNGKADYNDLEKFKKCGAIGKSLGLRWGGDFTSIKDMPHFEIANFTFPKVVK